MKESVLMLDSPKTGDEEIHTNSSNNHGTTVAKAQLAWLLLLVEDVIKNQKIPTVALKDTRERVNRTHKA